MPKSKGNTKKPLTFKIPAYMYKEIEAMVEEKLFDNRAELIREAIQKLIDYELQIPSIKDKPFKQIDF